MWKSRVRGERGATAVLMAFGMIGLLAFGGLVIDGGNAFSQRRQMQNAADTSATAGANELYRYKAGVAGAGDVYTKALNVATSNGASAAGFTCVLVFNTTPETSTPCQGASTANKNAAWKVRVTVNSSHSTRLMRVVGVNSFTAGSGAAAGLLNGTVTNSPFMICAAIGTAHTPPLLIADVADPTGWSINPGAVGHEYDIWGNAIKNSDCGLGNDFRGLVDNGGSYSIPGVWPAESGNKSGHDVGVTIVDGCAMDANTQIKDTHVGCIFGIPLCDYAAGPKSLHCVKVGRFQITSAGTGPPHVTGRFLGAGLVTSGAGAGIATDANDVLIIKLVE